MTKGGIALQGVSAAAPTSRRLRSIFLDKIDRSTLSFDSEALDGQNSFWYLKFLLLKSENPIRALVTMVMI